MLQHRRQPVASEYRRGVRDRAGYDRRYALSSAKLTREIGWGPKMDFEHGLAATIRWYCENSSLVERVKSGEYRSYYNEIMAVVSW